MGEFSAEWLALREPADHRARSTRLTREIASRLADRRQVRVLDLAAGTGSNLRYLARYLPPVQHWRMVDRDPALLARVRKPAMWAIVASVHLQPRDLSAPGVLADVVRNTSLVTASALLDLVSDRWLGVLAERCRAVRAAALFALTYDGRILCTPPEPDDESVRRYVNQHQRTDKGFGSALGPDATDYADGCFAQLGFTVERDRTNWTLGAGDSELQRQLIDGWASAAVEMAPESSSLIDVWRVRRLAHVAAGRSTIVVGHEDLAAWIR
jgi:hypothetical protein